MKGYLWFTFFLLGGPVLFHQANAQTQTITVKADQLKGEVQPTMWGVFFEDINFGADGGIYAELVKNRSFEFNSPLMGWKEIKQGDATGGILILNRGAQNEMNPRFARITVNTNSGT